MPNPLRKLPTKPGRTAPSSRVKKKKKSGQSGFIGPRKFKDELAEDRTTRRRDQITSEVIGVGELYLEFEAEEAKITIHQKILRVDCKVKD